MPRIHVSLSGHRIEYPDPDAKTARFLQRLQALVDDPKTKTPDVVALIFGSENPIMDHTLFPERGAVTKEVLANPVYHVMTDLLARQQVKASRRPVEDYAKPYTLTVAQAAERKGVSPDAIRKAIKAHRLPSWVREGEYFLNPQSLDLLDLGARGPVPAGASPRLKVRVGASHTGQLQIKYPGGHLPNKAEAIPYSVETALGRWQRAAVLTAGHDRIRMFVLEPGEQDNEVEFEGYWVRGKFNVVQKINGSAAARRAWESFTAS